jgi:SAM-dependent methyltransferase
MYDDDRFVRADQFPGNQQQALEALDPWVRSELESARPMNRKRLLCLAAGGGTHGPLLAMAGACVTVVDFSSKLLEIDQSIAVRTGLSLNTVEASMDDLSCLASQSFDIVIQPVSLCYVPHVIPVYQEVARVIKPHGLYVAQHKQPVSLQAGIEWNDGQGYSIATPAEEGREAPEFLKRSAFRETGTTEYIHPLDSLIGGLCRCGFVIEDFYEPPRGDAWAPKNSYSHRSRFLPPYLKVKARRK